MKNLQHSELLSNIKKVLNQVKLRPTIKIDQNTTEFQNQSGEFFTVNFYWDEYYMDKLYFTPKWEAIIDAINNTLKSLFPTAEIETGSSDGHLFFIISFKS